MLRTNAPGFRALIWNQSESSSPSFSREDVKGASEHFKSKTKQTPEASKPGFEAQVCKKLL